VTAARVRVRLPAVPSALRVHALDGARPAAPAPGGRTAALLELKHRAERDAAERQAAERAALAVERALGQLPALVDARLAEVARHVTELALAVAGEVLGAGLAQGLLDPAAAVARCLAEAVQMPGETRLTIRLSAEDLPLVLAALEHDPRLRERTRGAHIVPDRALARGAVELDTGAGRLRYEPREVFQRMAAAVRKDLAGAP
jgi:hypothetical protein